MPASKPNPEAGKQLKNARMGVCLSTREVERLSQKLAQEKNNQDFAISHAWLTEIEKGEFTPSIYKLYSLSIIYKRAYHEVLGYFGLHLRDSDREQSWLSLPHTHLVGEPAQHFMAPTELSPELRGQLQLEKTNLVSRMLGQWAGLPAFLLSQTDLQHSLYGYVGTEDFTLFPLIRPGSIVQIDASQKRIGGVSWSNEFDRPIYFVELHDSYVCSWCELRQGRLLLIPYPQSRSHVRAVRFPDDAGIVGRVIAVSMRIAEQRRALARY